MEHSPCFVQCPSPAARRTYLTEPVTSRRTNGFYYSALEDATVDATTDRATLVSDGDWTVLSEHPPAASHTLLASGSRIDDKWQPYC